MLWWWVQASRQLSKPTASRVNLTGCRLTKKEKSIRHSRTLRWDADGERVLLPRQGGAWKRDRKKSVAETVPESSIWSGCTG